MIRIEEHQIKRIDAIAKAAGEQAVDVFTRALVELGDDMTAGELTGWLWDESVRVGLEHRSAHRSAPEHVAAWQAIEEEMGV
jgi:hypothetical protein